MVTIIRYAQRIQYLYASFNNILVVSWRPFFFIGERKHKYTEKTFDIPYANVKR
jgi:hypothetical protein